MDDQTAMRRRSDEGDAAGSNAEQGVFPERRRADQPASAARQDPVQEERVLDVQELLNGGRCARILHGERRYLLRITKQNKLILTRDESAPEEPALRRAPLNLRLGGGRS